MGLEQLTMLNAKVCRFDTGSGGLPGLVPEDIAGALAGLGRPQYLWALRVINDDAAQEGELLWYLVAAVTLAGREAGWISDDELQALNALMMGWIKSGQRPVAAERSGIVRRVVGLAEGLLALRLYAHAKPPSQAQRARWCSISPSSWCELWGDRFDALESIGLEWEAAAAAHLKKRLRDGYSVGRGMIVPDQPKRRRIVDNDPVLAELAAVWQQNIKARACDA